MNTPDALQSIPYNVLDGEFLAPCEEAITQGRDDLDNGLTLSIQLAPGGYNGHVLTVIKADDTASFVTDWVGNDTTRFPARIKAAATALFNLSCFGRFGIRHNDGVLEIKRV